MEIRDALKQALNQWRMYADESEMDRSLNSDQDAEAKLYRACAAVLDDPGSIPASAAPPVEAREGSGEKGGAHAAT